MSNHSHLCKTLKVGLKVPGDACRRFPEKVQGTIGWKMGLAGSLYS